MRRLGLVSRILLILMCMLVAAAAAGMAFNTWERSQWKRSVLRAYPHMAQAAGIIDTVLRAKPDTVPDVLRAVSGEVMRAGVFPSEPPLAAGLIEAPRVAAKVQSLMKVPVGVSLRAYTDGVTRGLAYPNEGLEGVVRRVVLELAPGRLLVIDVVVAPPNYSWTVFGLPSGFWIGFLGCLVAGVALTAALRELGPVRRLTKSVRDFDGRLPPAIEAGEDRSEIGRLVEAVGDMQSRIATLIKERSFLIGAISHDAKTYLTRMRLRTEKIDDAHRRAALVRDIDAMTDLIDTSLSYARGTSITPHHCPVDLADLAAAEIAEREAIGTDVVLTSSLVEAATVEGDPVALKRVLTNLIGNGVKFGAARVDVAVSVAAGSCRVSVGDDGPGISAGDREIIFTPFYRVEKSRSRQTGGTGLGLAIARQIVQAHGGTIEVSDAPLGGALLVVTLPAATRLAAAG